MSHREIENTEGY